MKTTLKTTILGILAIAGLLLPAHSAVLYSDSFRNGGTLDSNHWNVIATQNGYASLTVGSFLAVNGGTVIPDNN